MLHIFIRVTVFVHIQQIAQCTEADAFQSDSAHLYFLAIILNISAQKTQRHIQWSKNLVFFVIPTSGLRENGVRLRKISALHNGNNFKRVKNIRIIVWTVIFEHFR